MAPIRQPVEFEQLRDDQPCSKAADAKRHDRKRCSQGDVFDQLHSNDLAAIGTEHPQDDGIVRPRRARGGNGAQQNGKTGEDRDAGGCKRGKADLFQIMAPREATAQSLKTITAGKDSIAITGNVLRDYLTDLFPILELGTSAKMLSIVKLMKGGGLFETGAGGSAPKHVQQLVEQNHLRWDSMGEFCALGESLNFLADSKGNAKAGVLGAAAEVATQGILDQNKSPSRKVGEPDNRDSHYWFARFWAEALAAQSDDAALATQFAPIAKALAEGEAAILVELAAAQGPAADIGGYFRPSVELKAKVMRPSATLNAIID